MGRLYIPAVNQVKGPWLLSHEHLESLNALFNEIDDKLSKALAKTIETAAKQQMEDDNQNLDLSKRISKLQRKYGNKSKSATTTFDDKSTFKGNDIKEILNHINSHPSLAPVELYLKTIHGGHENEFNLIINSNPVEEEPDFEYRIKCLDYDIQLEIKTLIDKWIRVNKAPRSLQIWSNFLVYIVWIVCLFAILISYGDLSHTTSKAESYKEGLRQEIQKVIENKSYLKSQDSTILLLLKLESDYIPDKIKSEAIVVYDKDARKVFIASLIIFVVSLLRPRTIVGVGRKYNKYKFYKFWWTYIICGGIGVLFTALLADSFLHFISW